MDRATEARLTLPPSSLLLDAANPRLARQPQDQALLTQALAREQGPAFLALLEDIAMCGLDPLSLFGVIALHTTAQDSRYVVIDGNRRLAAIRVLESPTLLNGMFTEDELRRIAAASAMYRLTPVVSVECHRFPHRDASSRWRQLRHTGANAGAGTMPWRRMQAARFSDEAGLFPIDEQVIAFLSAAKELPREAAMARGLRINLRIFLDQVDVRRRLGLAVKRGRLLSCFPLTEIVKPLQYVVITLSQPNFDSLIVHDAHLRNRWMRDLPRRALPRASTRLPMPVPLQSIAADEAIDQGR